jgi:hypothetical protein
LFEVLIKRLGLPERSWKSIQNKPAAIIEPIPNDAESQFVREEFSFSRPLFGFLAEIGAPRPLVAEHGPCGGCGNAEGR